MILLPLLACLHARADAYMAAFTDTCLATCSTGDVDTDELMHTHCKDAANATPRPACKNACYRGYERGVDATVNGLAQALSGLSDADKLEIEASLQQAKDSKASKATVAAASDAALAQAELSHKQFMETMQHNHDVSIKQQELAIKKSDSEAKKKIELTKLEEVKAKNKNDIGTTTSMNIQHLSN